MSGGSGEGGRRLRVLGWPAFSNRREQPYNHLLYTHVRTLGVEVEEYSAGRALGGGWSVLHLHWPDRRVRDPSPPAALARSAALVALLDAVRLRGTRVVWTAHNLKAHEGRFHPWLEPRFWSAFTRRVDGFVSLSESGVEAVREAFPVLAGVPGFVIPHGTMRSVYPDALGREEARRRLGLPAGARVVAFLGQLRPYKNVPHLVRTFRRLPHPEARLLVAGKPKPAAHADEVREAAGDDVRVRIFPEFVPDAELQLYLRAADLVALPYRDILNSGSAMLALAFDRPVLVPRRGAMGDLARDMGSEWVRTYEGELTPEVLEGALEWATGAERPASPPGEGLAWSRIARLTVEAYRAVGA